MYVRMNQCKSANIPRSRRESPVILAIPQTKNGSISASGSKIFCGFKKDSYICTVEKTCAT